MAEKNADTGLVSMCAVGQSKVQTPDHLLYVTYARVLVVQCIPTRWQVRQHTSQAVHTRTLKAAKG
jgi:hypothetical protein